MRGHYKVRVRVPIYATAIVEHWAYNADSEAAAIAEAQDFVGPGPVGEWFIREWRPHSIPTLSEVIEFEATETDTPKEGTNEQDY
jgi:hypothetical protein